MSDNRNFKTIENSSEHDVHFESDAHCDICKHINHCTVEQPCPLCLSEGIMTEKQKEEALGIVCGENTIYPLTCKMCKLGRAVHANNTLCVHCWADAEGIE